MELTIMTNQITKSIIIQGLVANIYDRCTDFKSFPKFMKYIKSVKKTGDRTSHWVTVDPRGNTIQWDLEITRREPNSRLAWISNGGDIKTSGQVTFTSLPNAETEVTIILHYVPSPGLAANAVAERLQELEAELLRDLRNFKAFVEGMYDRIV
jgi:uncharacterized membrane protein